MLFVPFVFGCVPLVPLIVPLLVPLLVPLMVPFVVVLGEVVGAGIYVSLNIIFSYVKGLYEIVMILFVPLGRV